MTPPPAFPQIDPADLDHLRSVLRTADPEGRLAPIGMRRIEIGPDTLSLLPEMVADLARGPRVVLVMDGTPMRRAGRDLKADVRHVLEEQFTPEVAVIGAGKPALHGDEGDLAETTAAVRGADCVVSVGSGTITDLCKEATRAAGGLPFVVVQTAASVNAFSDDLAVLMKDGVKRTIRSRWPDALVIDLQTLADAPRAMNLAGFGDLLAVWTAPADWYLASVLGMDDFYHPAPVAMLREPAQALLAAGALLGSAGALSGHAPRALDLLARVLTLSGFTMGVTGKTTPLSGTEHLIGHLIDMAALHSGRPTALHGAQVGIATVHAAAAWQIFLTEFDPGAVDIERLFPETAAMESVVRGAFAEIDPDGRAGRECWSDYRKKLERWRTAGPSIEAFLSNWPTHRAALEAMLAPPERLRAALEAAGAPTGSDQLTPSIDAAVVRWALLNCHLMRNRFTLADLLYMLGWWNAAFVERLLT
jgi:glycerol-1-phosphate dehydrogenase [NAD(P)+]